MCHENARVFDCTCECEAARKQEEISGVYLFVGE
jgi:hypothetical protein